MTGCVTALIGRYFGSSRGELEVGTLPISAIVATAATPLFVYDATILDRKWRLLRETFPPQFSISYSVKANPNPFLMRYFLGRGCGLEIASAGEFRAAENAGCPPGRLLFAGPGKTETELELVLASGIGEIHAESRAEVERIRAICRRLHVRARVALRVNPSEGAEGGAMRMGGRPAPFGIDEEGLDPIIENVLSDDSMEFRGVHLFAGTQILDVAVLIRQYRKGVEIATRIAERWRRPLQTLDFGGGLGIPYFDGEEELDMAALARELSVLIGDIARERWMAGTQLVIEPGRYLVGEAGVYVTRVTDVKTSRGKKFLVVDGGMNHHLAASGNLGRVVRRNFPVALLNKLDAAPSEKVDVVGPLCTPLDVIAREVELPAAEIGDLLGVFQSGAYARTASPLGFLSHPTPPEALIVDGRPLLIRRRGTHEDWLRDVPEI